MGTSAIPTSARGCRACCGARASPTFELHVIQPAGYATELKMLQAITLARIADAVLADLPELETAVDELYAAARDDDVLVSLPRIVQTWGRRPA